MITSFFQCSPNTSQMLTFLLGYGNIRQRYRLESQVIYGIYGSGKIIQTIKSGLYPKFRSQISVILPSHVGKKF
jgi:hypothetical protein